MTDPLVRASARWTVDDLTGLDYDKGRYEIFDGSLVVTPPPPLGHVTIADRIADSLKRQVSTDLLATATGAGIGARRNRSYFVPDAVVGRRAAFDPARKQLEAGDVLLAVEVLSPSNSATDLVLKRHEYAALSIPMYWIVDPVGRTVMVLELRDGPGYVEAAGLEPGDTWATDRPFPLTVAAAEFFT